MNGWEYFEETRKCYYIAKTQPEFEKSWHDANDWCMTQVVFSVIISIFLYSIIFVGNQGGRLTKMVSDGEKNFVAAQINKGTYDGKYWIGAYRKGQKDMWERHFIIDLENDLDLLQVGRWDGSRSRSSKMAARRTENGQRNLRADKQKSKR